MRPSAQAGPGVCHPVSDQASSVVRLKGDHVACLSLFAEPSEPLPEEPKLEGMAFHHCHKDRMPGADLSPERLRARRQLCAACAVCVIFMAGEVVGKLGTPSSLTSSVPRPSAPGWRSREREGLGGTVEDRVPSGNSG